MRRREYMHLTLSVCFVMSRRILTVCFQSCFCTLQAEGGNEAAPSAPPKKSVDFDAASQLRFEGRRFPQRLKS